MTYNKLTDQEKERIFAEDVLEMKPVRYPGGNTKEGLYHKDTFAPLSNMDDAMLGVEKLSKENKWYLVLEDFTHKDERKWQANLYSTNGYSFGNGHTPQKAIVEACIRIKRLDLFEGE